MGRCGRQPLTNDSTQCLKGDGLVRLVQQLPAPQPTRLEPTKHVAEVHTADDDEWVAGHPQQRVCEACVVDAPHPAHEVHPEEKSRQRQARPLLLPLGNHSWRCLAELVHEERQLYHTATHGGVTK